MRLFDVGPLLRGRLLVALAAVVAATVASTAVAARVATETDVNELFFGPTRSPAVQAMIDVLGRDRTAVVVYLVQRSFDAVVIATAISPLFIWLLGSTAIDASARLAGSRRPFLPVLIFFGYAAAIALLPGSLASLALGVHGPGAQLAQLVGSIGIAWLAVASYRAIRVHYDVGGERAFRILLVAVVLFYLVPFAVILAAGAALIIVGVILEYF